MHKWPYHTANSGTFQPRDPLPPYRMQHCRKRCDDGTSVSVRFMCDRSPKRSTQTSKSMRGMAERSGPKRNSVDECGHPFMNNYPVKMSERLSWWVIFYLYLVTRSPVLCVAPLSRTCRLKYPIHILTTNHRIPLSLCLPFPLQGIVSHVEGCLRPRAKRKVKDQRISANH